MHYPLSILVPTYGRTRVIGECVQSFLQQDYDGPCEMVILNDRPDQHMVVDPTAFDQQRPVTVVNITERFPDLGTKRSTMVEMATHELIAFWDDDDIYLPGALRALSGLYHARRELGMRGARASHVWQLQHQRDGVRAPGLGGTHPCDEIPGTEMVVRDSGCMWNMVVERRAVQSVGGFPAHSRMQDCALLSALSHARLVWAEANTPGIPQCIHRLVETGYGHAIDFKGWRGPQDNLAAEAVTSAEVAGLMSAGIEPAGEVCINPGWKHDYAAIAARCWTANIPGRRLPRHGEEPSS